MSEEGIRSSGTGVKAVVLGIEYSSLKLYRRFQKPRGSEEKDGQDTSMFLRSPHSHPSLTVKILQDIFEGSH
ncbi:hypothetical protein STEG23_025362 [Scotinomys teguina]